MLNPVQIQRALQLLGERLALVQAGPYQLIICGGAGLMMTSLISRQTTKDVDVVAMMDQEGQLFSPDPLPPDLLREVEAIGRQDLDLPTDWLNNGPSREPGGLFQLGLPEGFKDRLTCRDFGPALKVYFAGRLDQICFKVFASVDQGAGRHVNDLMDLQPTAVEMETAAHWAMTQDPSEGFRQILRSMLRQLNYEDAASKL